ncbi:hypothetical protein LXL04_008611 [Taraxacum kok-saghyz]
MHRFQLDLTPDIPKEAKVDTHLIWNVRLEDEEGVVYEFGSEVGQAFLRLKSTFNSDGYFSLMPFNFSYIPQGVLDTLEKIRRRFLWGGTDEKKKIHWVSWDKVIAPKDKGGLGVGSIYSLNIGLIVEWWWRLKTQPLSLWRKIIGGIHKLSGRHTHQIVDYNITGVMWKNIVKAKTDIRKINLSFHDIFKMQVSDQNREVWSCALNQNGVYCMESLRLKLDQSQFSESPQVVSWRKDIPIKVIGFVWKVAQGRIASAAALSNRGVPVMSTACTRCGSLEDADHILVACPFATKVRDQISTWIGVPLPTFGGGSGEKEAWGWLWKRDEHLRDSLGLFSSTKFKQSDLILQILHIKKETGGGENQKTSAIVPASPPLAISLFAISESDTAGIRRVSCDPLHICFVVSFLLAPVTMTFEKKCVVGQKLKQGHNWWIWYKNGVIWRLSMGMRMRSLTFIEEESIMKTDED